MTEMTINEDRLHGYLKGVIVAVDGVEVPSGWRVIVHNALDEHLRESTVELAADVLTATDAEELTKIIDRLTNLYGLSRVSPTVKLLQALADRAAAAKKGPRE